MSVAWDTVWLWLDGVEDCYQTGVDHAASCSLPVAAPPNKTLTPRMLCVSTLCHLLCAICCVLSAVCFAGGYDHTVKLWDVRAGPQCSMSLDHGAPVEDVAFFPSGGLLVSAGGTSLCVWDLFR